MRKTCFYDNSSPQVERQFLTTGKSDISLMRKYQLRNLSAAQKRNANEETEWLRTSCLQMLFFCAKGSTI